MRLQVTLFLRIEKIENISLFNVNVCFMETSYRSGGGETICPPPMAVRLAADLQVNSALHPSGVAKSSTSFGWGKGGNVTSAGWQVTLYDPIGHVSSRSGAAGVLRT